MRTTWMAAALAVVGLAACGGGGDGDDGKRTSMACGNESGCMIMQSDIPANMTCGAPEVASCDPARALGMCVVDENYVDEDGFEMPFMVHATLYVYDPAYLEESEADCQREGGTWTTLSAG